MIVVCSPRALRRPEEYMRCWAGPDEASFSRERRNWASMVFFNDFSLTVSLTSTAKPLIDVRRVGTLRIDVLSHIEPAQEQQDTPKEDSLVPEQGRPKDKHLPTIL